MTSCRASASIFWATPIAKTKQHGCGREPNVPPQDQGHRLPTSKVWSKEIKPIELANIKSCWLATCCFSMVFVGWLVSASEMPKPKNQRKKKHTVWRLQSSMIALGCQANARNKFYNIFLRAFSICQVWFVPIEWSASWWTQILGWGVSN